jgi:hypothetical protein
MRRTWWVVVLALALRWVGWAVLTGLGVVSALASPPRPGVCGCLLPTGSFGWLCSRLGVCCAPAFVVGAVVGDDVAGVVNPHRSYLLARAFGVSEVG